MARALQRLTALKVDRLKTPGLYADGGGLYLQIKAVGARSWVFRYRIGGRKTPRDLGLGSAADVSLADARQKAAEMRKLTADGVDPIEAHRAARASSALAAAKTVTFETCAAAYINSHKDGWGSPKHVAQWTSTLNAYAFPKLGKLPVGAIDVGLVMKVLEPIWSKKPETASRVRGRVEAVLDWAKARGFRVGENPARWRGCLDMLLPKRSKVQRVKHHPALPYPQVGAFMKNLRAQEGTAARAFEFLILTASRTSETIGARWDEIDMAEGLWTVPADRIKGGKEHRVPLSGPALALLKQQAKTKDGDFVFPGGKRDRPLSTNAILALLKRMKRDDLTAHGFRSSFRDWAAEQTNYARDVAEMALAHTIGDKVEAAYRRGDLFDKRKRMMADWAKFCGTVARAGTVIAINRGAAKR